MKRFLFNIIILTAAALSAAAQSFSLEQCRGSRMPYPAPDSVVAVPDSLAPVMIYHVGRHGDRYPTSADKFLRLEASLEARAAELDPKGAAILQITRHAIDSIGDRWGQLNDLGVAEQQGIARRLCMAFPQLVVGQRISAESSYVERCVESMNAFVGVLYHIQAGFGTINTDFGPQFNALLRPFQVDTAYIQWTDSKPYKPILEEFSAGIPTSDLDAYYVLSSIGKMDRNIFSLNEFNRLWQVDNLRQYLTRTHTTISALPAEISAPLLQDLIDRLDAYVAGTETETLRLHFAHAETLMPLLSLMRLPSCYYLTHYFDTVYSHWQTFNVVPMAANLQVILMRSHSDTYYVRFDLNERPVDFPGHGTIIPWSTMRTRLLQLLP
ncbi:MAG: histidine phosphatase family protein [Muribaculaceae bacterium]|nr:histidine phosphatase family protein [Muribaculaceae bacterium]